MLDSVFHVPADFVIAKHELLLGDLSLQFTGPGRQILMLRQVYPADLALERREMADWLEFSRFRTRRHFCGDTDENWVIEHDGRRLKGVQRTGVRIYPFPLGVVRPLYSIGAVVRDAEAGRLLVVEHDSSRLPDEALLRRMILSMNQLEEPVSHGSDQQGNSRVRGRCRVGRGRSRRSRSEMRDNGGALVTVMLDSPRWVRFIGGKSTIERSYGLDRFGMQVYEACDGKSTVRRIVKRFAADNGVGPAEAELAVSRFLKTLMAKGLIVMEVARAASEKAGK